MESQFENGKLIENSQKEPEKEIEIVNAFNSLTEIIFKGVFKKLEIKGTNCAIIFDLVENSLNYIEKSTNNKDDNFDSIIALAVFRTLFIDKSSFKMKDLDNKINSFKLILELFQEDTEDNPNEFKEMTKYELFENIAKEFNCNYYYSYCFYLIHKYSESKIFFLNTFLLLKKESYKIETEIDLQIKIDKSVTEEELEKIGPVNFLNNLNDIYVSKMKNNFCSLEMDKIQHQIKIREMSIMEIQDIFEKNIEKESKIKKKNRNKKDKAKKNKNLIINENNAEGKPFEEEKLQEENKFQEDEKDKEEKKTELEHNCQEDNEKKKIQVYNENPEENKYENKNDEIKISTKNMSGKGFKTRMKNIDNKEEEKQDLSTLVNGLLLKINELEERERKNNGILTEKIDELKKEEVISKRKIDELKKENCILIGNIEKMKKDIISHKKRVKFLENSKEVNEAEILQLKQELIKVKNELKLIKLRDVFKNIIDLFCVAFYLSQDLSYIDKVKEIKKRMKIKKGKEEEWSQFNNFFDIIYKDFQLSNGNAHSIDISSLSIIDQVFEQIDQNKTMENVKKKLKNGTINFKLTKLAINRMNNFDDKVKFKLEEKKIMETVNGIDDIYPSS